MITIATQMDCDLREDAIEEEIIKASLLYEDSEEKRAKILFHSFYTLLVKKNVATCVLTEKILTVEVCVV